VAYEVIRDTALRQRQKMCLKHTPRAMKILYEFWRQFLSDYFNPDMYHLFRHLAINDASCECGSAAFGLAKLLAFYDVQKRHVEPDLTGTLNVHYEEALEMSMALGKLDPSRPFGIVACKMCEDLKVHCETQQSSAADQDPEVASTPTTSVAEKGTMETRVGDATEEVLEHPMSQSDLEQGVSDFIVGGRSKADPAAEEEGQEVAGE